MISDATLAGAAAPAMDAPVPYEVLDLSRARSDRELHDGQFVGPFQELEESGLERGQVSGRVVELALRDRERIEIFVPLWLGGRACHHVVPFWAILSGISILDAPRIAPC